jgi:type VI secretion system secreted protein VgrG
MATRTINLRINIIPGSGNAKLKAMAQDVAASLDKSGNSLAAKLGSVLGEIGKAVASGAKSLNIPVLPTVAGALGRIGGALKDLPLPATSSATAVPTPPSGATASTPPKASAGAVPSAGRDAAASRKSAQATLSQVGKLATGAAKEAIPATSTAGAATATTAAGATVAAAPASGAASALTAVSAALGPIGIAATAAAVALDIVGKTLKDAFAETQHLVSKANPAVMKRFTLAFDDMEAVVGHRLTPVMETATKITREIGDVLATVLPNTSEMRDVLAPLGDTFKDVVQATKPLIFAMKEGLSAALHELATTVQFTAGVTSGATEHWRQWAKRMGMEMESSMGAAARPAKVQGIESYLNSAYASALSSGGNDPGQQTAKNTKEATDILKEVREFLRGFGGAAAAGGQRAVEGF